MQRFKINIGIFAAGRRYEFILALPDYNSVFEYLNRQFPGFPGVIARGDLLEFSCITLGDK